MYNLSVNQYSYDNKNIKSLCILQSVNGFVLLIQTIH